MNVEKSSTREASGRNAVAAQSAVSGPAKVAMAPAKGAPIMIIVERLAALMRAIGLSGASAC